MPDDLTTMLDALADDAQAAARLGTAADIRRRARRQTHRAMLGAGTLTAAATALIIAIASTLTGGPHGPVTNHGPTPTPHSFRPDPSVYHAEAWLPAADVPMASRYQWTFTAPGGNGAVSATGLGVTPICGSHYPGSNSIDGSAQVGTFLASAGNGGWSQVLEMLYFLPSTEDAAATYSKLLPDLNSCLAGTSGYDGTNISAGFTAHATNGFGWHQQYQFQAGSPGIPRIAADYILAARHGSVIAVFSAIAAWDPGQHGPAYDTSGDQQALDALAAHLAAYTDPASSASATGTGSGGTLHGTEMLLGGPYQNGQHPAASGTVSVRQDATLIASTPVKNGTFTVALLPGTYTVTDTSWPGCNSVIVTITPGRDATAQLTCDLP